jgi:glycosyltransferase involved in cell wall biosynthesis
MMITGDYPPKIGGVSSHAEYLASALVELGSHVTVLTGGRGPNESTNEILNGVKIHRISSDFRGLARVDFESALKKGLEIAREDRPDVIHAQHYPSALIGLAIKHSLEIPLAVTIHTTPKTHWDPLLVKTQAPYSVYHYLIKTDVDAFIAPSQAYRKQFLDIAQFKSSKRIHYIPHGIPIKRFCLEKSTQTLLVPTESESIICPSRLDTRKQLEVFIRACAIIHGSHPALKFWITGEPRTEKQHYYCKELLKMAEDEGLSRDNDIRFRSVSPDEMPSLYRGAAICVLPSDREGLGLVLLEAMASKTPVVATRTIGIDEVVKHEKTGLVFEPGEHEELAEQINRLIEDKALRARIVKNALRMVEDRYSSRLMAKRHLSVYKAIREA